jgi:hypothetical protein
LYIIEAFEPREGAPAPAALAAAADYTVAFPRCENARAHINAILAEESLMVMKKTKSGVKMSDIRPDVISLESGADDLSMRLRAGASGNLQPRLVLGLLFERMGCAPEADEVYITRTEAYAEPQTGAFVPLRGFAS